MPKAHRTQSRYCFWYMQRVRGASQSGEYAQSIKPISSFGTVEGFWKLYNHMTRPSELPNIDLHVFKEGVKPMWEDDANKRGGKVVLRMPKGLADRCWEAVMLGMIGEQFNVGGDLCGVVLSVRGNEDIISVWHRTADDQRIVAKIQQALRALLSLPENVSIEYKRHGASSSGAARDRGGHHDRFSGNRGNDRRGGRDDGGGRGGEGGGRWRDRGGSRFDRAGRGGVQGSRGGASDREWGAGGERSSGDVRKAAPKAGGDEEWGRAWGSRDRGRSGGDDRFGAASGGDDGKWSRGGSSSSRGGLGAPLGGAIAPPASVAAAAPAPAEAGWSTVK